MICDIYKIPNEWHKEPAFNCVSDEHFRLLQDTHLIGDTFAVDDHDCECETFTLNGYHRCNCGNRRCCLQYQEYNESGFFFVEVW